MNKAEEFVKANDFQLGENEDGDILMLTDDEYLFIEISKILQLYADEQSRERAGQRAEIYNHMPNPPEYSGNFDDWWKSNQEGE